MYKSEAVCCVCVAVCRTVCSGVSVHKPMCVVHLVVHFVHDLICSASVTCFLHVNFCSTTFRAHLCICTCV